MDCASTVHYCAMTVPCCALTVFNCALLCIDCALMDCALMDCALMDCALMDCAFPYSLASVLLSFVEDVSGFRVLVSGFIIYSPPVGCPALHPFFLS